MKKIIFLFACATLSTLAYAQTPSATMPTASPAKSVPAANGDGPKMKFEYEIVDYGDIIKGSDGNREFAFTNVGNKPLEITDAQKTCGCTIPTWPKEPIAPGGKNVIKVHYDTKREGPFTKTVTLITNAPGQESFKLTIKGNVIKEADPAPTKTGSGVSQAPSH